MGAVPLSQSGRGAPGLICKPGQQQPSCPGSPGEDGFLAPVGSSSGGPAGSWASRAPH